jgi:hypothetical protein
MHLEKPFQGEERQVKLDDYVLKTWVLDNYKQKMVMYMYEYVNLNLDIYVFKSLWFINIEIKISTV